jgi:opacity protein-like surface antigen
MKKKFLLFLLGVCSTLTLAAQNHATRGTLEVAVNYNAARNGEVQPFWFQGGNVQLEGRFWRGLGAVAEVGGLHTANMHGAGVGLDLITASFGPRYTIALHDVVARRAARFDANRRVTLYGETLAGVANGLHSVFPATGAAEDSATGFALALGGGINYRLSSRLSVRALEANWLRTTVPNGTDNVQNNLRLGAGLVWHVKN